MAFALDFGQSFPRHQPCEGDQGNDELREATHDATFRIGSRALVQAQNPAPSIVIRASQT
jgi:hypothetical protein